MQQTNGVAVLATQLSQTDRRALSQAWYSALHLAGGASRTRAPVDAMPAVPSATSSKAAVAQRLSDAGASSPRAAHGVRGAERRASLAGASRRDAIPAQPRGALAEIPERRAAKSALARQIERGVARRAPRAETASFVVRGANGRVHLVVRAGAGPTRVVAVCAPALRERVERALAQARFVLAGEGVPFDGRTRSAIVGCGARAEAA